MWKQAIEMLLLVSLLNYRIIIVELKFYNPYTEVLKRSGLHNMLEFEKYLLFSANYHSYYAARLWVPYQTIYEQPYRMDTFFIFDEKAIAI